LLEQRGLDAAGVILETTGGKSILDAACGPGKYAEILLAKGATVTGFDISPKVVELAKERNGGQGNFFVHDLSKPFETLPDGSFDILCALALQYVHDWTLTMQEFHRVLKPQGKPQFFSPRYKTKLGSPNQHFQRKNAYLSKTTADLAHFLAILRKIT
jgi:ubiquinone/menaquinone biosynthesis C-methylase UbiE